MVQENHITLPLMDQVRIIDPLNYFCIFCHLISYQLLTIIVISAFLITTKFYSLNHKIGSFFFCINKKKKFYLVY